MAAPIGNHNAANACMWKAAINRALEKRGAGDKLKALDDLAEKLLLKCDEMDMSAIKEFGNRIDGMPAQLINLANEGGEPFKITKVERVVVDPKN